MMWKRLAFDGVDLNRFDLDAELFKPGDGTLDLAALSDELEANEADLVGHACLADIRRHGELVSEFIDNGASDELRRIHEPEAGRFHDFYVCFFSLVEQAGRGGTLASGDGRNNRDDISLLDRGLLLLKETHILVIHEDVHETTDDAILIDDTLTKTGKGGIKLIQNGAKRGTGGNNLLLIIGEFTKRGGDADGGHGN